VGEQIIVRRGDIFWADFGMSLGSEQGGHRPALIIQNNIANESSETTIIAAITSRLYDMKYPFHVRISAEESGLPQDSTIKLEQIRTISKVRLISLVGKLPRDKMKEVNEALKYSLSIVTEDNE
jgi:mRNA interferase MazF